MSAHTPGPWQKIGSKIKSIGITERLIAAASVQDDEGQANATLIASAPDLLALCVQSRALMVTMLAEELNVQECIRNISKVSVLRTKIAALSSAIDRATGEDK